MKPKLGRPKLSKDKRKSFQIGVRLTPYEHRTFQKAMKASCCKTLPDWMATAARMMAVQVLCNGTGWQAERIEYEVLPCGAHCKNKMNGQITALPDRTHTFEVVRRKRA